MHTFGNICDFLESGIWKSGNCLELAGFDQFQCIGYFSHSIFVTELDFVLRNSKFQFSWNLESGNLEVAWNLLFWANSNILGIIPTQFWSLKLILSSEFQNSSFPEIWNLEIWKYGICLELADFDQFQCVGYFSQSIFVTQLDIVLRNSKFQFSRSSSRNFLEIGKISGMCCFGPIPTCWVLFPLSFSHWNRFWPQNFKIPVFLRSGIWTFSGIWLILTNFNVLGIFSTQFLSLNLI